MLFIADRAYLMRIPATVSSINTKPIHTSQSALICKFHWSLVLLFELVFKTFWSSSKLWPEYIKVLKYTGTIHKNCVGIMKNNEAKAIECKLSSVRQFFDILLWALPCRDSGLFLLSVLLLYNEGLFQSVTLELIRKIGLLARSA